MPSPVYSYSNGGSSSSTYFIPATHDLSSDVYTKPGPPYFTEPNLGSAPVWPNAVTANSQDSKAPSPSNEQRSDSRPASSNGEKKTDGHSTTEMNIVKTTTTAAAATVTESDIITSSPPPLPLPSSPVTDEQIEKFAEKLNTHVDSLEKFRAMARKKLREAMARSGTSDEELSQFFDPQSFQKRQLIESSLQTNPQFTNSVW